MARTRIRTIKPEFFKHEGLFDLERETGLPIRMAFAGLWTCCDREGRFEWRPRWLKSEILPYDEVDFSRVIDTLATRGFLVKYAIDSETYGCIPSWKKHQVINNKELPSVIPSPTESILIQEPDACTTALFIPEAEGKGERNWNGNGTEGEAASPYAPSPQQALNSQPETVPSDLHPLQYAGRMLQELGMPETKGNTSVVAASISALIRDGRGAASAYEFLLAKAKDARDEGIDLDKFWFEDSKWRSNGGKNGKPSIGQIVEREQAFLRGRRAQ